MTIRPLFLLAGLWLAACGPKPPLAIEFPPPRIDESQWRNCAWLTPEQLAPLARNTELLAAWTTARTEGETTAVFLPLRHDDGSLVDVGLIASACRAFQNAGIRTVGVYPLFLGAPTDEFPAPVRLDGEAWAGPLPRLSPAATQVRADRIAELATIATLPIDALCISHAGFPSVDTDFGEQARFAFEGHLGVAVPVWPDSVATTGKDGELRRGPLWQHWTYWKAAFVANHLAACVRTVRETRQAAGSAPLPVLLMVGGYFPLHANEAVNWASADALSGTRLPDAPANYERTAAGDLFDGFVLECFVPLPRETDAEESGFEAWSSVRGAIRTAEKLTGGNKPLVVAVSKPVYAGADGTLSTDERALLEETLSVIGSADAGLLLIE